MARGYVSGSKRSPWQGAMTDLVNVHIKPGTRETEIGQQIEPEPETGCWVWTGRQSRGYGIYNTSLAHRFVYETLVGPIPEGYDVHHWCLNKRGCNPQHLEALSRGDHGRAHGEIPRPKKRKRAQK